MDTLDNPTTPKEQSTKIICEDYPQTYKVDYVPALIQLSPEYAKQDLQKDLDVVLSFYKKKLSITCA